MSEGKVIVSGQLPDGSIALVPLVTADNKTLLPVSLDYAAFPADVYLPAQQYIGHDFLGVITPAPALSANAVAQLFDAITLAPGASDNANGVNWDVNSAEIVTSITAIDVLSVITLNLYASDGFGESLVASWVPTAVIGSSIFFVSPFAVTTANVEKRCCFPAVYRVEAVVSGAGIGATFTVGMIKRNI